MVTWLRGLVVDALVRWAPGIVDDAATRINRVREEELVALLDPTFRVWRETVGGVGPLSRYRSLSIHQLDLISEQTRGFGY